MVSFKVSYFILYSIVIHVSKSKWIQGTLRSDSDWEFLTRFCFLSQEGTISYEFKYPLDFAPQELLLYYDTPGQWDAVYKRGRNCTDSKSVLREDNNQVIRLTTEQLTTALYSGCTIKERDGKPWYYCSGTRGFQSSRERWWYVAISRCTRTNLELSGMYLEYKVHMTNGEDLIHKEYSADEFYILPVDIVFFLIYIIIALLSVICAIVLRSRQLFHTSYQFYMASVFTWTFHLLMMVIAWGHYGSTGWEVRGFESIGRITRTASTIIFILMLILMAKGFTITRGRLTRSSLTKIVVFFSAYVVVIAILFVWEGVLFDAGQVLYYYESPPGYGMIVMHLLGWLWFLYATVFTLKNFKSHHKFYIPFFTFFTVWFWAAPVMVLTAMYVMPKWSREKTVNGVEQFIGFCGHIFFLVLTRPNAANKNFPYHIRTSQIGFINSEETGTAKDNNPYVVSSGVAYSGSGPNLEFFITSRSVSKQTAAPPAEAPRMSSNDNVTLTFKNQPLDNQHESNHSMRVSATTKSVSEDHHTVTIINSNISVNNNYSFGSDSPVSPSPSGSTKTAAQTNVNQKSILDAVPARRTLLPPLIPSAPPIGSLTLINPSYKSFQ